MLLALMLFAGMVSAANSYDLDSFSEKPMQAIVVEERDEVRFDLLNGTHTVIFDRVRDVGFRFTGYAYLEDENSMNGFATKKMSSYVDVNKDDVYDLVIAFYDSTFDEKANKTYATVVFKTIENPLTAKATGVPDKGGVIKERVYSKYLAPIGAVAFVLVLVLVAMKSKRKPVIEKKEEAASEQKE